MLRIEDDALGAPASVGKFVGGRYSPNAQRRANKRRSNASARTSIGGHGHSIRMVNELQAARSTGPGIRYLHHAKRTFFATGQVLD
jgi:hypothetical protein